MNTIRLIYLQAKEKRCCKENMRILYVSDPFIQQNENHLTTSKVSNIFRIWWLVSTKDARLHSSWLWIRSAKSNHSMRPQLKVNLNHQGPYN